MNQLEHMGDYDGYQLYRNADGIIEGYKKTGKRMSGNDNMGTDCKRIVSTSKTVAGWIEFYLGTKLKAKKVKPAPLPKLPFDES